MVTTNVKTDVIDADAHVVENERVWDYLDTGEEKYRPTLLAEPGNSERQHWVLDGEDLGPKFPSPNEKQSEEHLKRFGREVKTPVEARELGDVSPTAEAHGRVGDRCASALQLALAPAVHAPPGSKNRALLELEPLDGGCLETWREPFALELRRSGVDPDRSCAANSLRQGTWRRRCLRAPLRKGQADDAPILLSHL